MSGKSRARGITCQNCAADVWRTHFMDWTYICDYCGTCIPMPDTKATGQSVTQVVTGNVRQAIIIDSKEHGVSNPMRLVFRDVRNVMEIIPSFEHLRDGKSSDEWEEFIKRKRNG